MSVSSTTIKSGPYSANGIQTTFPFSFKCFSKNDIRVVLTDADDIETDLVVDSTFSVTLNSNQNTSPGGSITTSTAYATGYLITVVSDVEYTQEVSFTNFRPDVVEKSFDKLTLLVQQLKEQISRAVKTTISSVASADDLLTSLFDAVASASGFANDAETAKNAAQSSAGAASTSATNSANSAAAAAASAATVANKANKGANNDITSLSGLTTPLSKSQGGLGSAYGINLPIRNDETTETLTVSLMGQTTVTSTACTKTLPLLSAVPNGSLVAFQLNASVAVTVQRQGSDELSWNKVAALNSVKLTQYGDYLLLVADTVNNRWRVLAENIQGPAFSATYSGGGQTLGGANVRTKLEFSSETTDTHGNYDPSTNYRFTPSIPGWYMVEAQAFISGGTQTRVEVIIYKNGAYATSTCGLKSGASDGNFAITGLVYLNGSSDYIEVYANGVDANVAFANTRPSRFVAVRIR